MATSRRTERGAAPPRQLELTALRPHGPWFNERRALEVFRVLAHSWENRDDALCGGFYAGLIPPQQEYTPDELRGKPLELGRYFFFQALTMRGGINSVDAFRATRMLWEKHPVLFDPVQVVETPEAEFLRAIRQTAHELQGARGTKGAGTYSYKLEENVNHWRENARRLIKEFGGDIRTIYQGVRGFEEGFARVDGVFKGMRRKIFSLLTMWLQEFGLIPEFALPIIVDFHCLRVLFEQEILLARPFRLGPGKSKNPARRRPPALRNYLAVRITERLVDEVIWWSQDFLIRHRLDAYAVSHGLWFLSRELCAAYHGNKSFGTPDPKRRAVTARLVTDEELRAMRAWPRTYRDPCRFCPVEDTCRVRIPAGPYYDWGVMVHAGAHIPYPGRRDELATDWRWLPARFRNAKARNGLARRPTATPKPVPNNNQLQLFLTRTRRKRQASQDKP